MTTLLDDSIYKSLFDKYVKQHKGENHVCVLSL